MLVSSVCRLGDGSKHALYHILREVSRTKGEHGHLAGGNGDERWSAISLPCSHRPSTDARSLFDAERSLFARNRSLFGVGEFPVPSAGNWHQEMAEFCGLQTVRERQSGQGNTIFPVDSL